VLFIQENQVKKQRNFSFSTEEWFQSTESLQKKYLATQPETTDLLAEMQALKGIFDQITQKSQQIDASLVGFVQAEAARTAKQIEGIEAKLRKAQKQKYDVALAQIAALKQSMFPAEKLQERTDNFVPLYLKQGGDFIKKLIEICNPLLQKDFLVVEM
jgi:uncharacterized protein YllA (UPF0747 family)